MPSGEGKVRRRNSDADEDTAEKGLGGGVAHFSPLSSQHSRR